MHLRGGDIEHQYKRMCFVKCTVYELQYHYVNRMYENETVRVKSKVFLCEGLDVEILGTV